MHCVVCAVHTVAKDDLHSAPGPSDLVAFGEELVLDAFRESVEPGRAEAAVTLGDGT